jgi:hypothetical protein
MSPPETLAPEQPEGVAEANGQKSRGATRPAASAPRPAPSNKCVHAKTLNFSGLNSKFKRHSAPPKKAVGKHATRTQALRGEQKQRSQEWRRRVDRRVEVPLLAEVGVPEPTASPGADVPRGPLFRRRS